MKTVILHQTAATRLDSRGRVHLLPRYSRVKRQLHLLLPGYPYHPLWYPWKEHIRGCLECVNAAVEDEVCDLGLGILNAFYSATLCRWETRPEREENAAFWHRLKSCPGLI